MNQVEVEVGRPDLADERVEQGTPLALLHGLLGDSGVWRRQIEALSDEFEPTPWRPRSPDSVYS